MHQCPQIFPPISKPLLLKPNITTKISTLKNIIFGESCVLGPAYASCQVCNHKRPGAWGGLQESPCWWPGTAQTPVPVQIWDCDPHSWWMVLLAAWRAQFPSLQTSCSLQMGVEINAGDCPRQGCVVLASSGSDKDWGHDSSGSSQGLRRSSASGLSEIGP